MRHPRWVRKFLSDVDLDVIQSAVIDAESRTAAEIRVHLDHRCSGDPMARAVAVFERLGMHRTAGRHAVLVYVAISDHKLAVIGDRGIHERVGQPYWDRLVAAITAHFRDERPRDGFVHALAELGGVLAQHFPRRPDDVNELGDELTISP